jgi:hypothetical protein
MTEVEKLLWRVRKGLEQWSGGDAALWEYHVSLRRLVVRLQRSGVKGNLHLTCGDTDYITGPTKWQACELAVEDAGEGFVVRDAKAGFTVRCGTVGVEENVEPVF